VAAAARHAADAAGLGRRRRASAPLRTGLGRPGAGYATVRGGSGVTGRSARATGLSCSGKARLENSGGAHSRASGPPPIEDPVKEGQGKDRVDPPWVTEWISNDLGLLRVTRVSTEPSLIPNVRSKLSE
jgi:hypothetical protein